MTSGALPRSHAPCPFLHPRGTSWLGLSVFHACPKVLPPWQWSLLRGLCGENHPACVKEHFAGLASNGDSAWCAAPLRGGGGLSFLALPESSSWGGKCAMPLHPT